jgi:hypothetical protein
MKLHENNVWPEYSFMKFHVNNVWPECENGCEVGPNMNLSSANFFKKCFHFELKLWQFSKLQLKMKLKDEKVSKNLVYFQSTIIWQKSFKI